MVLEERHEPLADHTGRAEDSDFQPLRHCNGNLAGDLHLQTHSRSG
jgi:hypothetical protein